MDGAAARPCTSRRQWPCIVGSDGVCGAGFCGSCRTRQCIMAGNACGARAFLGPPVCTSMVLCNPSDMGKVQTPWNSLFRNIVSVISIVGNARDPRAFPRTSWQYCARVAGVCDAALDHSPSGRTFSRTSSHGKRARYARICQYLLAEMRASGAHLQGPHAPRCHNCISTSVTGNARQWRAFSATLSCKSVLL